ncbi:hypothetical protein CL656_05910 [bacterium]|nr:hypothetical protein [bacterium]|tara:strand:- start:10862 stop:11233 length:372 start_codon:yes stop_codon:yes gene_type:complete
MNKKVLGIVIALVLAMGFGINYLANMPGPLDDFTKCLAEKETIFYGSFLCPACQQQKSLFGSSKKYLPYIECSNPDRSQTQACIDAEIENYPTWFFGDGSVQTGILELEVLAEKSGCQLPSNE